MNIYLPRDSKHLKFYLKLIEHYFNSLINLLTTN